MKLTEAIVGTLLRNTLIVLVVGIVAFLVSTPGQPVAVTRSSGVELHESFAEMPDGPAPAESVTNFSGGRDAAAPYVRDGFLTTADPDRAVGGSYRIARLAGEVSRIGAEFAFTPHSAVGGVLCLSIQSGSIADTSPVVPASPVHFIVTPTGWALDVNRVAGESVERVASGDFAAPLASDGSTLHRVELVLDRVAGKLRITLPEQVLTFSHEAFALAGDHVYVEPFKSPLGGPIAEQTDALVRSWWADGGAVSVDGEAVALPTSAAAPASTPAPDPALAAPVGAEVAPVVVERVAPERPRRVRAVRDGRRVEVSWHGDADRFAVRCGSRSRMVKRGTAVTVRAKSRSCKVRSVSADGASSRWVRTRVRR